MTDTTVIGSFLEQVKKIKKDTKDKITLVFRSPSNIKGLHEYIYSREITNDELEKFLNDEANKEITKDGKLKKFVKDFLECEDKDINDKTIQNLYKFWYKQEKPSLFKNPNFIKNEDKIYADFIASNPDEFNNMTTFDKLTKMRHYDVPNRLLDVTFDPLLALYFSLGENNDGSNTVFIYPVKEEVVKKNQKESKPIKNFDSDTITVLSIISRLKIEYKNILYFIVKFCKKVEADLKKELENLNKQLLNHHEEIITEKNEKEEISLEDYLKQYVKEDYDAENKIKEYKGKVKKITITDLFNFFVSTYVSELDWQLKKEIPSWYSNYLSLNTFTQCYLVKPKMNNPRIIAQSGAFIIYPFKDTEIKDILAINDINDDLIFKIDKTETDKLKNELKLLNIKETKYMPDDLSKYATEIKNKYNTAKIKKS